MAPISILPFIFSFWMLGCFGIPSRDRKDSYGDLLKPPPLPRSLGGRSSEQWSSGRQQRQNTDYKYIPPPPLPSKYLKPSPFTPPRFNAPPSFAPYTNYGPPSQRPPEFDQPPTPPPGFFHKLSSWLFPPPENIAASPIPAVPPSYSPSIPYASPSNPPIPFSFPSQSSFIQSIAPKKKDCNPCNLVPWIPVIRYQTPQINSVYSSNKPQFTPVSNSPIKNPVPISYQSIQFGSFNSPQQGYGYPSSAPPAIDSFYAPTTAQGQSFIPYNPNGKNSLNLGEALSHPSKESIDEQKFHSNDESLHQIKNPNESLDTIFPPNSNLYQLFDSSQNFAPIPASAQDAPQQQQFIQPSASLQGNGQNLYASKNEQPRAIPIFHPIPIPNLSSIPIPPLFNARPFKDAIPESPLTELSSPSKPLIGSNIVSHGDVPPNSFVILPTTTTPRNDVQVIHSVPLAEYTSSVEYPINIIQSPLWEIDANKQNEKHTAHSSRNEYNQKIEKFRGEAVNKTSEVDNYSAESGGSFQNSDDYTESVDKKVTNGHQIVNEQKQFDNQLRFVTPVPGDITTFPNNHRPDFNGFKEIPSGFDNVYGGDYQNLDSSLLYLKPSAPYKNFKQFHDFAKSTVTTLANKDEETTLEPSTLTNQWFESEKITQYDKDITEYNDSSTSKKPKIIQIIIPYTNEQPSPFKQTNQQFGDNFEWTPISESDMLENQARKVPSYLEVYGHNHDDEYHQNEESRVSSSSTGTGNTITTTEDYETDTTTTESPEGFESTTPMEDEFSFDLARLQQNIDDWTEQEYSKYDNKWQPQKISTMKNFAISKNIPDDFFKPPTSQRTEKKMSAWLPNHLNSSFYDHEVADSIQHPIGTDLHNITVVANINNSLFESNLIVPSKDKDIPKAPPYSLHSVVSSYKPVTTTMSYWEKIQTSISPLTMEKVYVVTPLSWSDYVEKRNGTVKSSQNDRHETNKHIRNDSNNVYYPRFSIRPTPVPTGNQKVLNSSSKGFSIANQNHRIKFSWPQSINDLEEPSEDVESSGRTNLEASASEISASTEGFAASIINETSQLFRNFFTDQTVPATSTESTTDYTV